MKKSIALLIVFTMLLSMSTISVGVAQTKVTVDGKELKFDIPPTVVQGRTLVPLRTIFESLGATIQWDQTTKTVTGTKGDITVVLTIGQKSAKVNGKAVELEVPGTAINNRTMVPARFIAEALGAKVDWDSKTQTVVIKSKVTTYKVLRVVDGDTLEIDYNGTKEKLRLIGVDTPESVHPDATRNNEFGEKASKFTKGLLENKEIELEFDVQERDKYGRLLAYVWINGKMYNKTLVEEGYAKVATYPPNVKYVDDFTALQKKARENNKGLWAYEAVSTSSNSTGGNTSNNTSPSQQPAQTGSVLKVKAGENATVVFKGTPNTEYSISVYYSSGASNAAGLEPKKTDANGNVSWTWKVGTATKPGKYKIIINGDKKIEMTLEVI